ncbi:MAG TPA: hypothetical protein VGQ62_10690, partial [Chloroflexota bacterium]|nr:hypothetical protein [Chloroflexota bacterium]
MSAVPRVLARSVLAVLLSLAVVVTPLAVPVAAAQDATGLDGVRAAYHDLLDLFYRPLVGSDLLQAGWTALRNDVERRGAPPAG